MIHGAPSGFETLIFGWLKTPFKEKKLDICQCCYSDFECLGQPVYSNNNNNNKFKEEEKQRERENERKKRKKERKEEEEEEEEEEENQDYTKMEWQNFWPVPGFLKEGGFGN